VTDLATTRDLGAADLAAPAARWSRAHAVLGTLAITETISWGIIYYAFAVFLAPMRHALDASTTQLTGAFSVALMISGMAGIAVGRWLDHRSPRALMTLGSLAGAALIAAWSQVQDLLALYAVWVGLGLVMATVLYEPAFAVLTKWFAEPHARRRAMTAMTLVGALASFFFLPLSQALIDHHGWRHALLVLAAILATVTVPLHALVLRPAPRAGHRHHPATQPSTDAAAVLRSRSFWALTTAFFLGSLAATALTVHLVVFLVRDGATPPFAAFAVGLIGVMQIPGRLLFGPIFTHASRPVATASVFIAIALGVAVIVSARGHAAVLIGAGLLGMGNGMATLARATAIADLYGPAAYGHIAGVAASATTGARAAGPFAAALWAAAVGYPALLWTLVGLAAAAAALAFTAEASMTPHQETAR
jgi:MFS family permease